jgi:hypothetical protein
MCTLSGMLFGVSHVISSPLPPPVPSTGVLALASMVEPKSSGLSSTRHLDNAKELMKTCNQFYHLSVLGTLPRAVASARVCCMGRGEGE